MPYLTDEQKLDLAIRDIVVEGELNYSLTIKCLKKVRDMGVCYTSYNGIIGCLVELGNHVNVRDRLIHPPAPTLSRFTSELYRFVVKFENRKTNLTKDGIDLKARILGAVECAKLELYRRAVVPYEKKKIKENGDVYD
tara:strand:+ start:2143 stop:2556 length:414 start_codon:yes stop_codon:yes gene_type:complete